MSTAGDSTSRPDIIRAILVALTEAGQPLFLLHLINRVLTRWTGPAKPSDGEVSAHIMVNGNSGWRFEAGPGGRLMVRLSGGGIIAFAMAAAPARPAKVLTTRQVVTRLKDKMKQALKEGPLSIGALADVVVFLSAEKAKREIPISKPDYKELMQSLMPKLAQAIDGKTFRFGVEEDDRELVHLVP